MSKTKGYSLWLMPIGEVYNKLNNLISELSRKYNTPHFEPHVTLIGEVLGSEEEIVLKTAQLTSVVRPYRIELGRVEYLNEYFRCLFLRVRETHEVMRANQISRKIFGRETDPKYMPHLSLMYGDFAPQIKEEIIAKIGKEIFVGFDVESIHLFSTNGEPKDWYRVKEFSLK
jgi:2'-5' RNA ligase